MNEGTYAYRFSGYAVKNNEPWQLVGIGTMTLKADNTITGFHTACSSPMEGFDAALQVGRFSLTGSYGPKKNGFGANDLEASITFTQVETENGVPKQVLDGTFSLVPAGAADGFWLISTGAYNNTSRTNAVEVVSGEAMRIGNASA